MNPFVERHQSDNSGVLSCLDRVVITGTLPAIAHDSIYSLKDLRQLLQGST